MVGVEIAASRLKRTREGLVRMGARADLVLAYGRTFGSVGGGCGENQVRSAALRRLAQLEGPGALETLLRAFSDREASVRSDAAHLAAELGADAVPRMREVALAWPSPAPETAITALRWSNVPGAVEALRELADAHPDPGIRSLAALAIGRPLGDAH